MTRVLLAYFLMFVGWALIIAALLAGWDGGIFSLASFVAGLAATFLAIRIFGRGDDRH